ncbi:uncharacterized protein zgc:174863 isoform X2 [Colossoma macropomum]|uniref:uncharacterized protein zgc:174863 isoform X2 n=1 Tax=Colossoma macropomum TaxID=42526 RepID=UPI001864D61A|nr:uncharacterized protein zgc:174863 isoform X2 [Colossoma macropomum]
MASAVLLFLTVMLSSVHFGAFAALISLECQPAVGVVGQITKISCSFKMNFGADQKIIISAGAVTKRGETEPLFWFKNNTVDGDDRFKLLSKNDPSLLLSSTAVSDEGLYDYTIVTNRGIIEDGTFRISVTAKYSKPTMSSWRKEIEDGGPADLYCNASGGYPAGAIHWFDSTNTNWTTSATLKITEREDKLVHLSSKLTYTSIDSSWAPFRCVVLNSKFVQEGEETFQPNIKGGKSDTFSGNDSEFKMETKYVAPIVVIGSLIVGLLLVLLLRGRCSHPARRPSTVPILSDFRDVESGAAEDVTRALTVEEKPTKEVTEMKT